MRLPPPLIPALRIYRCSPAFVRCVACAEPIRRIQVVSGSYFATCDYKRRRPGTDVRSPCNQRMYVWVEEGEAHAVPLTVEQYDVLQQKALAAVTPPVVCELLGIKVEIRAVRPVPPKHRQSQPDQMDAFNSTQRAA
ncbi:MAG TPA: hypothetical protein VNP72_09620 [Longimicrobium sp.]|nr:hypothetical protein [Longimicrobium sp.]